MTSHTPKSKNGTFTTSKKYSNERKNSIDHDQTNHDGKSDQDCLKGGVTNAAAKANTDVIGNANGNISNKDFVHITNDDLYNREMQAFSLPKQFHTLNKTNGVELQNNNRNDECATKKNINKKLNNNASNNFKNLDSDSCDFHSDDLNGDENDSLEVVRVDDGTEIQEIREDQQQQHKLVLTNVRNVNIEHSQTAKLTEEKVHVVDQDYSLSLMSSLQEQTGAGALHHHVHKHRAKAVMTILSARVIDVNSLRDIHVGLPKGTAGFVFCGRQLFSNSDHNAYTHNHHHHGLDNDENQLDFRDDLCHPLSILSSDHDYFDTSRDYLCSVDSIEEAQNWVAALRWAANIVNVKSAQNKIHHRRPSCDPYFDDNSLSDESFVESLKSIRSPVPRKNNYLNGLRRKDNLLETLLIEDDQSFSSGCDEHDNAMSYPDGIAIVTKVENVGIKLGSQKRALGFQFEIKYEVKMLLLRNIQLSNRSRKRRNDSDFGDTKSWSIQERTMYCSISDIIDLLDKLHSTFSNNEEKNQSKPDVLEVIKGARKELSHYFAKVSNPNLNYHSQVKASIERVDKVVRTLAFDKNLCNATLVKDFLLKDKNLEESRHSFFIQSQLSLLIDDDCSSRRKCLHIAVGDSIDEFVKKWLIDSNDKNGYNMTKRTIMMLENPIVEFIVTCSAIYLLYQCYIIWSLYLRRESSIRIDSWIIQGVFMFYWGYKTGSARNNQRSIANTRGDANDIDKTKHAQNHNEKSNNQRPFAVITSSKDVIEADEDANTISDEAALSSPLPFYSKENPSSSWSRPLDKIFKVRGRTYLCDRVKVPSDPSPMKCRGIDMWLTNNPERNIARHPSMLGGKLGEEDTFLVNFLLPFGNFVTYFSVPPLSEMPSNVAEVWTKFINGNQQDRDARIKLLPVVVDGPWIVKKAVGHGPALLGQAIPLQYYFTHPSEKKKGVYEVDVIITASRVAKGILNVVKSHTKRLSLAIAFIIEAATESELPETVLCSCELHYLHLELCPSLPQYFLEDASDDSCD